MTAATTINSGLGANPANIDVIASGQPALPFEAGTTFRGDQNSDWVYVTAGSGFSTGTAVVDGSVVTFDKSFVATLLANAAASGKIGQGIGVIRTAGTIAQGNGFWVQIRGQANIQAVGSAGTGFTKLNTSTTAGALTSTATGGTNFAIGGAFLSATVGSSTASVEGVLNYPQITAAN